MGEEMSLDPKLCLHGGGVMWVESNCNAYCNAFKLAFFSSHSVLELSFGNLLPDFLA